MNKNDTHKVTLSCNAQVKKVERKTYRSPHFMRLGSMKKMTMGKTASGIDNLQPNDFVP